MGRLRLLTTLCIFLLFIPVATACQYYLINVTSGGANGAIFGDGFTLYSGESGTGTNILNTYIASPGGRDSAGTGGDWTWNDGANYWNLSVLTNLSIHGPVSSNRPYITSARIPGWVRFNLTGDYEVLSGQFEGQADPNWKMDAVTIYGGNDGVTWDTVVWTGSFDVGNTLYTFNVTDTCAPVGANNFSITAKNNYGETLNTFNATIDGVTYNTTTGTITTHVLDNSTSLYNITLYSNSHDNRTYANHNVSSNLAAVLNFSYYRLKVNATQKLNGNAVNKFSVTIGSQVWNTTSGSLLLNLTKDSTVQVFFDPENYTTNTSNITMNNWLINHSVSVWPTNSLNITFKDEVSAEKINLSVWFSLISTSYATNHTTTNGTFWIDDLPAGDYEIRYSGAGYDERNYFFTLTNRTYNSLTLYLLNASTDITNTLYDEYGNLLPNYYIKLLRYYVSTNSYILVDQGLTNFEGKTVLEGVLNSPYYKFIITDTEGNVFKETSGTQLHDTSISHFITLGNPVSEDLSNLNGITTSLSFLTASNQFKYTWDNSDGTAITATLEIYTVSPLGNTLYNTSSTTASSGTMYLAIEEVNGTTYLAEGYAEFSGESEPTLMETLTQTFSQVEEIFGVFGLFLTAIILISMVALGLWSPPVASIMVGVSLILTRVANLHTLEWTYVTAISVVAIIIAYIISDKA